MSFSPARAEMRFGCGLSPSQPGPNSVQEVLNRLEGPDRMLSDFPLPGMPHLKALSDTLRAARKAVKKAKGDAARKVAFDRAQTIRRSIRLEAVVWQRHLIARRVFGDDGFRERLAAFWGDHFTAHGQDPVLRYGHAIYAEEAIRPHLTARFSDMLRAVITHPMMLRYLDQARSAGPNSRRARKGKKKLGLNENLARELLELHTLGVGGPYDQTDVRQTALLLTGFSYDSDFRFVFNKKLAEPGQVRILGQTYGGKKPVADHVFALLDDLAMHPITAQHLARKLVVHFIGDRPDDGLVQAMADAYLQSGGQLMALYRAMLSHPAAWADGPGNVKRPIDFVASSLRALDLMPRHLPKDNPRQLRRWLYAPLLIMGQNFGRPDGPDGFPEADGDWISPQRLAARIQWAMTVPFQLRRALPDPRDFVDMALGDAAPEPVRFAAKAAETRAEGVGLVLSSPAFQRM